MSVPLCETFRIFWDEIDEENPFEGLALKCLKNPFVGPSRRRTHDLAAVKEEYGIDGAGTIVGIMDTGVDVTHPALADRWRGKFAPAAECWIDAAGIGDTSFPVDRDSDAHGTHVMGTIWGSGAANNRYEGGAPGAGKGKKLYLQATNQGPGTSDNDSVVLIDPIPANTDLYVNDLVSPGTGPIWFADLPTASGLTYSFIGLGSSADDLAFSNDNGATYNYTPAADADGFDQAVTHIRVSPGGTFAGDNGSGSPGFEIQYKVRIR